MCGIAGFTKFFSKPDDPSGLVRSMTDALRHRGPDGEGIYSDAVIELGHRRLSIIDLENGRQPMHSEDGRYHIVFNGEIYNYLELRKSLESQSCRFVTNSDTEVLLRQFIMHGPAGLADINGMFAFAVWDSSDKSLFIARDRIGIKPLHYTVLKGELIFASEIKSLLKYPGISRELDLLSVSKYFSYGYIPAPHTIYREVHKLEPGHYLRFRGGDVLLQKYWDIPIQDRPPSGYNVEECAGRFADLLKDAIRKQMRSDVAIGVFLSGGIDSSLITAMAASMQSGRLQTFSIGFEEASYDESRFAREVAERFGTEHHHDVLTSGRARELIPSVMGQLDEPFADASIVPTSHLSQYTSRNVKVALGGDGGDELFAGYPSFKAHRIMEALSVLPVSWRDVLVRLSRRLPVSTGYTSAGYFLEQFFKGAGISPEIRFLIWMGSFGNEQKNGLFSESVRRELLRTNPFEDVVAYLQRSGISGGFERLLYLSMKMYLQDGVLVKVDRASMGHSLEVRVPYLDHHIVEFVSGIQTDYKLRGFTSKYLLKKVAGTYLPAGIINRPKAGFMIPLAGWLRGDLRGLVDELCAESLIKETGLFNYAYVRSMLDDHYSGRRDYRKMIWTLLAFQFWYSHRM